MYFPSNFLQIPSFVFVENFVTKGLFIPYWVILEGLIMIQYYFDLVSCEFLNPKRFCRKKDTIKNILQIHNYWIQAFAGNCKYDFEQQRVFYSLRYIGIISLLLFLGSTGVALTKRHQFHIVVIMTSNVVDLIDIFMNVRFQWFQQAIQMTPIILLIYISQAHIANSKE